MLNRWSGLELFDEYLLNMHASRPTYSEPLDEPGRELETGSNQMSLQEAIRSNRAYGDALGWKSAYDQIARQALGFTNVTPDEMMFASAIANWQRANGLRPDGILGPATWRAMRESLLATADRGSDSTVQSTVDGRTLLASFTPAERKALRITSLLETGKPLDFGGAAGNFDGQGVSFGLLQWNVGSGTLQPLLRELDKRAPEEFNSAFGPGADVVRRVMTNAENQPEPTTAQRDWAASINDPDQQVREPWGSYLERLGQTPTFRQIQIEALRPRFRNAVAMARQFLTKSERALAFFFDTATQNGINWLGKYDREQEIKIRQMQRERQLGRGLREKELLEVIAGVLADTSLKKWSSDVRERRMLIVNGSGMRGGRMIDLGARFGLSDQPFTASA